MAWTKGRTTSMIDSLKWTTWRPSFCSTSDDNTGDSFLRRLESINTSCPLATIYTGYDIMGLGSSAICASRIRFTISQKTGDRLVTRFVEGASPDIMCPFLFGVYGDTRDLRFCVMYGMMTGETMVVAWGEYNYVWRWDGKWWHTDWMIIDLIKFQLSFPISLTLMPDDLWPKICLAAAWVLFLSEVWKTRGKHTQSRLLLFVMSGGKDLLKRLLSPNSSSQEIRSRPTDSYLEGKLHSWLQLQWRREALDDEQRDISCRRMIDCLSSLFAISESSWQRCIKILGDLQEGNDGGYQEWFVHSYQS